MGIFASHCNEEWEYLGPWGVSVFLILSGFLMALTNFKRDLKSSILGNLSFAIRKMKALYPLHLLTMIAAVALLIPSLIRNYNLNELGKLFLKIVFNLFMVQSWIPKSSFYFSLNAVAWYLPVCVFVYFMFPFIYNKIKKFENYQLVLASLSVFSFQLIIAIIIDKGFTLLETSENLFKWLTYICPLYRLGDFVIGCCVGVLFLNRRESIITSTLTEVVTICLMIISCYIYLNGIIFFGGESIKYTLLFLPTSVAFVILFATNKGLISRTLTCKPLVYIGNLSASLFLIHQIIIRYIEIIGKVIFGIETTVVLKFFLALIVSVICAEIWNRLSPIRKLLSISIHCNEK